MKYQKNIRILRSKEVRKEIIKKLNYIFSVLEDKNHFDYTFFKQICCNYKLLEEKCIKYNTDK